jgi:tripartite-type tricarboxylate transporter receptor subunit TctC
MRHYFQFLISACMAFVIACTGATAEEYPNRPVRILVGTAAGSGPDVLARSIAAQLSVDLGQNFFVENRTGANATLASKMVAQSEADGYTLLFSTSSIAISPFLYQNLGYDPKKEITAVVTGGIVEGYLMLVNPDLPVKNVAEFIEYAKKNPVTYGTPGVGNPIHLATEVFRQKAGIDMLHVPFRGSSEVVTAVMSKTITVMFVTPAGVISNVREGQLRALAYTGQKPFPEFPNVPLVKDTIPGFAVNGTWGIFFAPSKTPPQILEKLNKAVQAALKMSIVSQVISTGGYIADGRSVEQVQQFFIKEMEQAGIDTKAAGIQPN